MRKYVRGLLVFLVVMSVASLAAAKELTQYEGTLSSIEPISNTFVLKTKSETVTIEVRPMSKVIINGERKPLTALRGGDQVKCSAYMKGDKLVLDELTLIPK